MIRTMPDQRIDFTWRGLFRNDEVNSLHADAFAHQLRDDDWVGNLDRLSLGWVTARAQGDLVGFVNIAWDGGHHAFVVDTCVATQVRRRGVGAEIIRVAREASAAAACSWLHVDFDDDLRSFYYDTCGFAPTDAGLIRLT